MQNKYFIAIVIASFIFGSLFFSIYHGWIIVRYPSYKSEVKQSLRSMKSSKKKVLLEYWHKKKWNKEKIDLLWTDDKSKNIQYLINSWLTLLDEEGAMKKKVSLQAILLSSSGNKAYLSFDRNPFSKGCLTFDKLMWIESLLKTLRENGVQLQSVYFLVHHQIMEDYHLDFSNPWPICGFLNLKGL